MIFVHIYVLATILVTSIPLWKRRKTFYCANDKKEYLWTRRLSIIWMIIFASMYGIALLIHYLG